MVFMSFFPIRFIQGYARVVLNLSSFYVMQQKPYVTVALHFSGGFLLDIVDGNIARYLDQCNYQH